MSRMFQDDDLLLWETYTAAPRAGEGRGARIMFYCLSDRDRRARVVERDEERTVVEKQVHSATDDDLLVLLQQSEPLA